MRAGIPTSTTMPARVTSENTICHTKNCSAGALRSRHMRLISHFFSITLSNKMKRIRLLMYRNSSHNTGTAISSAITIGASNAQSGGLLSR